MKIRLQLAFVFSLFFSISGFSQISDGTTAPDWTAVDLNNNTHSLYADYLNAGKHVVLEFSATWCGPCWNFHQTGTLETLYDQFGPDGTDQIMVFYVEADLGTNESCLYGSAGCNASSQGDWVTGHDFPFINLTNSNAPSMGSDYEVGYYPTVYAISANGNNGVYEVGQETNISVWESWLFGSFDMSMTGSVVDAWCPGEGSITVDVSNGAGTIDYSWSNGAGNSPIVNGLSAGTYTVTATDDNGVFLEETFVVDGPSDGPLTVELLASSDVQCNGESNGALNIGGAGGNGGYTFAWNTGDTGTFLDGLVAGQYNVVITDSEGCTSEESYTISEPDVLTLTTIAEGADCGVENGSVIAVSEGGTGPWSYDYGDGANATGTFFDIAPGQYIMSVTDANGCLEASVFTITSTDGPTAIAVSSESLDCNTATVTVDGTGSSEGDDITYAWSTTNGNIVSGADQLSATVDAGGMYTLLVTDNSTGCQSQVSIEVVSNEDTPETIIATPSMLTCNTTMITIDGTESSEGDQFVYAWSTADGNIVSGAATNMIEVDAPGAYSLLVTNTTNGCTSEESVTVSEDVATPSISAFGGSLDCATPEVEICANVLPGVMVVWTTADGEVESNCITVTEAGSYPVMAIAENGCSASTNVPVTLSSDLPQVSIDQPESLTCTVTSVMINATLEDDLEDYTIEWLSPNGMVLSTELAIEVSEPGMYTINVLNNMNGCSASSSTIVEEVIINPVSAFSAEIDNGSLVLTNMSTGNPSTYSWSFGATDENPTTSFDETGTYEICLTVTNDCGDDTKCQDVYFVSALTFDAVSTDIVCFGDASGVIEVVPAGGEPDYTISWTGPNGYSSNDLSIFGLSAGTYSMVLNDSYGYEATATYEIEETEEIVEVGEATITDDYEMEGTGSVEFAASGGFGELSYLWSNGATTASINGLMEGSFSVIVTDEKGCSSEFGPFAVGTITSVEDLDFVSSMSISPVPAINFVNITVELNSAMNTQMRIIDAYGKVIETMSYNSSNVNQRLDVTKYASGVYFVEFGNSNGKALQKFVVLK